MSRDRWSIVVVVLAVLSGCGPQTGAPPAALPQSAPVPATADSRSTADVQPAEETPTELIPEISTDVRSALEAMGAKIVRQENGYMIDIRRSAAFTDESIDLVLQCPQVVDLTLQQVPITDQGLEKLRDLPRLRRLILNQCLISSAGVKTLATLPLRNTVYSIGLRGTQIRDDDLMEFKEFPRLLRLDVSQTPLSDACLPALEALPLQYLNIEGTSLSDAAVEKLKSAKPILTIKR